MRSTLIATALALLSLTVIAVAQNQALKFEVASIKPYQQDRRSNVEVMGSSCHGADKQYPPGGQFAPPPLGRCVLKRVNLNALIGIAYKVGVGVSGGPGRASADYYGSGGHGVEGHRKRTSWQVICAQIPGKSPRPGLESNF